MKKYPAPKVREWTVQVEFLDGTTIDAASDEDAVERWRRIAEWSDPTVGSDPIGWMDRVLDRARTFYRAGLENVRGGSTCTEILDALDDADCIVLRRKT